MNEEREVLVALRKIIRAMDLYSRRLSKTVGLTVPQLLLLQAMREREGASISSLSEAVSLSQATVTSIIDRLEASHLVTRTRSEKDRRVVHATLTPAGEEVLESAPAALQEEFVQRFGALEDWEKSSILAALQRVATLMDADTIDASPVLHIGADIERSTST